MRLALLLFSLAGFAAAQDPTPSSAESPTDALARIVGRQRITALTAPPEARGQAAAYLSKWEKRGREAKGQARIDLGQLYLYARRFEDAFDALRGVVFDESAGESVRQAAMKGWAGGLLAFDDQLDSEERTRERDALGRALSSESIPSSGKEAGALWRARAVLAFADGDTEASLEDYRTSVATEPMLATFVMRDIGPVLAAEAHTATQYEAARKRGEAITAEFEKALLDAAPQRGSSRMNQLIQRMVARGRESSRSFLGLLGKPAPEWTALHVFRGPATLAALEGKVVLLYFWTTADEASVRGLAGLRDVARRFEGKNLAVVCATWPAGVVYPSRFDCDPDRKDAGPVSQPTRLAPGRPDADTVASFRKREIETIGAFLKNHEISWTAVLMPLAEVREKYGGLSSFRPTVVLLDASGRIRHIQAGPFVRGSVRASKRVPDVIEALLAEKGASKDGGAN